MFSLQNKIALVTGAGSGIGAAIAELFAKAGAHVFVTDRAEGGGRETVQRINESGGRAEFAQLDISEPGQCAAIAERVLTDMGRLDILVNNAGIGHVGTMATTVVADLDHVHDVNVRGTFLVTKAFIASMLARRSGVIVNIASIAGLVGIRDRLAYTISKHAIVGLTRAMALDHATEGIRVNAICPGRVETPRRPTRRCVPRNPWAAWASPRRLQQPPFTSRATKPPSLPVQCSLPMAVGARGRIVRSHGDAPFRSVA